MKISSCTGNIHNTVYELYESRQAINAKMLSIGQNSILKHKKTTASTWSWVKSHWKLLQVLCPASHLANGLQYCMITKQYHIFQDPKMLLVHLKSQRQSKVSSKLGSHMAEPVSQSALSNINRTVCRQWALLFIVVVVSQHSKLRVIINHRGQ